MMWKGFKGRTWIDRELVWSFRTRLVFEDQVQLFEALGGTQLRCLQRTKFSRTHAFYMNNLENGCAYT